MRRWIVECRVNLWIFIILVMKIFHCIVTVAINNWIASVAYLWKANQVFEIVMLTSVELEKDLTEKERITEIVPYLREQVRFPSSMASLRGGRLRYLFSFRLHKWILYKFEFQQTSSVYTTHSSLWKTNTRPDHSDQMRSFYRFRRRVVHLEISAGSFRTEFPRWSTRSRFMQTARLRDSLTKEISTWRVPLISYCYSYTTNYRSASQFN